MIPSSWTWLDLYIADPRNYQIVCPLQLPPLLSSPYEKSNDLFLLIIRQANDKWTFHVQLSPETEEETRPHSDDHHYQTQSQRPKGRSLRETLLSSSSRDRDLRNTLQRPFDWMLQWLGMDWAGLGGRDRLLAGGPTNINITRCLAQECFDSFIIAHKFTDKQCG